MDVGGFGELTNEDSYWMLAKEKGTERNRILQAYIPDCQDGQ